MGGWIVRELASEVNGRTFLDGYVSVSLVMVEQLLGLC